jgi:pimeloyl-ACP methyl ester carboxylesterase
MWHAPQGVHAFLRAYYHMKSADWTQNRPAPLAARTASEWAKLPRYYVMDLDKGMAETVASEMPSTAAIAACKWAARRGAEGLQQRIRQNRIPGRPRRLSGRLGRPLRIGTSAVFRAHDRSAVDVHRRQERLGRLSEPGALERLQKTVCTKTAGTHLVDGAGHWVQQEQPEAVSALLVEFLRKPI